MSRALKRAESVFPEDPEIKERILSAIGKENTLRFFAYFTKNNNANKIDLMTLSAKRMFLNLLTFKALTIFSVRNL